MNVVIVVSYSFGVKGSVTSEWVHDKIRALNAMGRKVVLVTSTSGKIFQPSQGLTVFRVPSLSYRDFLNENEQNAINNHLPNKGGSLKVSRLVWLTLSLSIGRAFDALFHRVAGSHSDGKWSWFLTALPVVTWQAIRHPESVIFSTGGPSVAHLVGLVASGLSRRSFYCEAQDPIIGSEMKISVRALNALLWLEKSLARYSKKLVFVAKNAAEKAKKRNPENESRITCIYPGAYDFDIHPSVEFSGLPKESISLVHLGHLYGSRNLDLLFRALDELVEEGEFDRGFVRVIGHGPAYVANREEYLLRSDYEELPLTNRLTGLRHASKADYLLLVQHADSRSEETIPFKTYDYLNIGLGILALISNPEIVNILGPRGFIGSTTDLAVTKEGIKTMVCHHRSQINPHFDKSPIQLNRQVNEIFSLSSPGH